MHLILGTQITYLNKPIFNRDNNYVVTRSSQIEKRFWI
jgi:hypothetical protein